ncbi:MAG TPA: hypothetical protein VHK88_13565, partial [Aquihabitans sp.]|nr:hypothetical protein [Aquihabitans sp.]
MTAPAATHEDPRTAWERVDRAVSKDVSAALGFFSQAYDQVVFAGRIIRRLPQATKYRKEILQLIADMTIGAGALVVGGGMLFVIFLL